MPTLRVGVIGVGQRARRHLSTIIKIKDKYRLTAICDIDKNKAEEAARTYHAKPYTSIERMLNKENLDVCLIAVQAEGHHVIAEVLAERGIHIITETPIAITKVCADYMAKMAERYGVLLEVSENVPRWPHERLKQMIVAKGVIGDVKRFYLSYTSGSYHGIAAIRSIIKEEAESVTGRFPSEKLIFERAEIRLKSGIKGIYENNKLRGNYWEIIGSEGALMGRSLHLWSKKVKLEIRMDTIKTDDGSSLIVARVQNRPDLTIQDPFKEYKLKNFDEIAVADAWISLFEGIVHGRSLTYGADNAIKDVETLMAIRESEMKGGVRVHLPLTKMTTHEKLIHEEFAKVYGADPLNISLDQLRVKYALPNRLKDLLYYGRVLS